MTADSLGRWLKQQGVWLTKATADDLRAYAASQSSNPSGKFSNTAKGLTHLVELLKPWGILCKPLPCSPTDEQLQRFDEYLEGVRGHAPFAISEMKRRLRESFMTRLAFHINGKM